MRSIRTTEKSEFSLLHRTSHSAPTPVGWRCQPCEAPPTSFPSPPTVAPSVYAPTPPPASLTVFPVFTDLPELTTCRLQDPLPVPDQAELVSLAAEGLRQVQEGARPTLPWAPHLSSARCLLTYQVQNVKIQF